MKLIQKIVFSYKFNQLIKLAYFYYYKLLFAIAPPHEEYGVYSIRVKSTGTKMKMKLKLKEDIDGVGPYRTILQRRAGIFEPRTSAFLKSELRPGDRILELGAAWGEFTILMSKYVGEKGIVYSYEPGLERFEKYLKPTVEINGCTNVILRNMALTGGVHDLYIDGKLVKSSPLLPVLYDINPNFIFIDIDAEDRTGKEVRQEGGVVSAIVEYKRRWSLTYQDTKSVFGI